MGWPPVTITITPCPSPPPNARVATASGKASPSCLRPAPGAVAASAPNALPSLTSSAAPAGSDSHQRAALPRPTASGDLASAWRNARPPLINGTAEACASGPRLVPSQKLPGRWLKIHARQQLGQGIFYYNLYRRQSTRTVHNLVHSFRLA